MNEHDQLKNDVIELAKIQIEMRDESKSTDLLQHFFAKRVILFRKFGMPDEFGNEELVEMHSLPSDQEVENIIKNLEWEGKLHTLYLESNYGETLREARANKLEALDVLPKLGVPNCIYTVFVYTEFLLHTDDNPLDILKALHFTFPPITQNMLEELALAKDLSKKEEKALIGYLKYLRIKHLDEFVSFRDNMNKLVGNDS